MWSIYPVTFVFGASSVIKFDHWPAPPCCIWMKKKFILWLGKLFHTHQAGFHIGKWMTASYLQVISMFIDNHATSCECELTDGPELKYRSNTISSLSDEPNQFHQPTCFSNFSSQTEPFYLNLLLNLGTSIPMSHQELLAKWRCYLFKQQFKNIIKRQFLSNYRCCNVVLTNHVDPASP